MKPGEDSGGQCSWKLGFYLPASATDLSQGSKAHLSSPDAPASHLCSAIAEMLKTAHCCRPVCSKELLIDDSISFSGCYLTSADWKLKCPGVTHRVYTALSSQRLSSVNI